MKRCSELIGKLVELKTVHGNTAVGTLLRIDCPVVYLKLSDGTEISVDCCGASATEVYLTPDLFWDKLGKE